MEENRKTELMNLAGRLERLRRLMGQDMPQPVQQSAPAVEEGEKQEKKCSWQPFLFWIRSIKGICM